MMKRFVWVAVLLFAAGQALGASLFVSADGDDGNPGTRARPFATLARARDEVRRIKSDSKGPIEVCIGGGTYYLGATLELDARDSGGADAAITYRAAAGERVVISGGKRLDLKWTGYRDGIMRAPTGDQVSTIDQLFVDGKLQHMARYPNYDPNAKYFGGTSGDAIAPSRVRGWAHPEGGFLHALHSAMWGSKHYEIEGVDGAGRLELRGGWQENRGGGYNKKYLFVENIFEELDAADEWYFDKAGHVLYFKPPAGMDLGKARVVAAGLKELILIRGSADKPVRNVSFEGITFMHTARVFMEPYYRLLRGDWSIARLGAVRFVGCEDCSISDCSFEDLGGNGVFISGYNRRVNVTGSRFTRLGESAVCVVGDVSAVRSPMISYENTLPQDEIDLTPGPKGPDYPCDCLVHNNIMHGFGIVGKQVAGVIISMAQSITVSHNTIYHCPRAAICINDGCWGGHVVEYNDAFNTVRESGDHGPFNSWGRDRWWKTPNHSGSAVEKFAKDRSRLDSWKTTEIRYNRFSHPGGHSWGIDLDDGSSNYYVHNNLCLGMGVKLREGFSRRVENNIIINGFGGFHVWMAGCDDVVSHNIFVSDKPYQFIRANPEYAKMFDYNLFYWPGGEPVITGVGSPMTLSQWKAKGFDEHSVCADPQFIDPNNGDYRVRAGSPALKLGFRNFAMDRFGVLKPEFQAEAAAEPRTFRPAATRPEDNGGRSAMRRGWMGAVVKNLVGEGEKSAVGVGEETGVLFVEVPADSAAAGAGFKAGDLLLALDGEKVDCVDDLLRLAAKRAGERVEAKVFRAVEIKLQFDLPR